MTPEEIDDFIETKITTMLVMERMTKAPGSWTGLVRIKPLVMALTEHGDHDPHKTVCDSLMRLLKAGRVMVSGNDGWSTVKGCYATLIRQLDAAAVKTGAKEYTLDCKIND